MPDINETASNHAYSGVAQHLNEAFSTSPQKLAEYERRGLIATNNLGLRMLVVDAGPESLLGQLYYESLFDSRTLERLERVRAQEPDLWQSSVAAHKARTELVAAYFTALQTHGAEDPQTQAIAQQSTSAEWHDAEVRTAVFRIIEQEPLAVEEAMALCS